MEMIAMKKIKKSGQSCITGPDIRRYGPPTNISTIGEKPKKTETQKSE